MNDLRSLEGLSRLLIEQNSNNNTNSVENGNDSPINQLPALTLFQRSKTTSSQTSASSSRINTQIKIPMLLNCDSLRKVSLKRTISTTNGKNNVCDISNCMNNSNDDKTIKIDNSDTLDQISNNSNRSDYKCKDGFSYINSTIADIEKLSIGCNEVYQSCSTEIHSKQRNNRDYRNEGEEADNIFCINGENKNTDQSRDGFTEQDQSLSLLPSCQQTPYLIQSECKNDIGDNIDNDEIDELDKEDICVNSNNDENGLSLTLDNIDNKNIDELRLLVDESANNTPEIIDTGDLVFNNFFRNISRDIDNEENKQSHNNNYNNNCKKCEDENEDDGLQFILDENNDSDDDDEVDIDYSDNGTDKFNDSLHFVDIKNNENDQNNNDAKTRNNETKSQLHPVLSLMDMYSTNTKNVLMNIAHFPNEEFSFFPIVSKSSSNIGTGTSGIVTKAFHLKSCNVVASKVCRSLSGHDIINFQREAALYQKFAHVPEITCCLGFGRDNENHLCMALEYMNMGSLSNLTSCVISEYHAKYIAKSILLALRALHSEYYVHNDIKPSNILINKRGDVKLSDFGCVKQMINKDSPLSHVVGSKHYFSPEKWLCPPPIQYTTKSDIWSLGITLYELLTTIGNENRNTENKANASSNNDEGYTVSPTLNSEVFSPAACDFIAQCLIQDTAKRPSCEDLLKHEWMLDACKVPFETNDGNFDSNVENENDLLFMIQSLIAYYSQKNFLQNTNIVTNSNNDANSNHSTDNPMYIFNDENALNFQINKNRNIDNCNNNRINHNICCENNDKKQPSIMSTISPTRIQIDNSDNDYTDNERIENIGKHTGYTSEQVINIIKYYVGDVRSKLMMKY